MKTRSISLFVDYVEVGRLRWTSTGVVVSQVSSKLAKTVRRLFERDFDASIGFPPMRFRAQRNSLRAFELGLSYLEKNLGIRSLAIDCAPLESRVAYVATTTAVLGTSAPKVELKSGPSVFGDTRLHFVRLGAPHNA